MARIAQVPSETNERSHAGPTLADGPPPSADVVRIRTSSNAQPRIGAPIALLRGMEITEGTRLEKALVIAACIPFMVLGLLYIFA